MSIADATPRPTEPVDESLDNLPLDEGPDAEDVEGPDEIAEETGLDLTDASELDADNVPADEEFTRTNHAPD